MHLQSSVFVALAWQLALWAPVWCQLASASLKEACMLVVSDSPITTASAISATILL